MYRKRALCIILVILAGVTVLWAGNPWKSKSPDEWSMEDAMVVKFKSPWVQSKHGAKSTADMELALHSQGQLSSNDQWVNKGVAEHLVKRRVEWASSRTMTDVNSWFVRRCAEIMESRKGKTRDTVNMVEEDMYWSSCKADISEKDLDSITAASENGHILINVGGSEARALLERFGEVTDEALIESAYLRPKSTKQMIRPLSVDIIMLETPRKITPVPFELKSYGSSLIPWVARFVFPRELDGVPTIGPDERKVEFKWEAPKKSIKVTFDLIKMTRDGQPDW